MLEFEYPYFLFLIFLVMICLKWCKERKNSIYFPQSSELFATLKAKHMFTNVLKFLILSTLIFALSSPIKTNEVVIDNSKGYEIVLIVDASGSMRQFNKFKIVKEIVADFISQRKNDKLALSIFADFAYNVVPLTYDKKSVQKLWSNITVGIAGQSKTALYEALFLSSKLFDESKSKEKIAILLTDGEDNTNTVPLDMAIKRAKENKIKVYTIGVGGVGNFNPSVLKQIAKQTNGKYFTADSGDAIAQVYQQINKLEKSKIDIEKYIKKTYLFQYPLSASLFLSLIYFFRKNRWSF